MYDEELLYILKSKIRFYILLSLKEDSKTPKELSSKYYMSHISANLKDLVEKDYVVCITPKNKKNKKFKLTKKSEEIIEYLHKITK